MAGDTRHATRARISLTAAAALLFVATAACAPKEVRTVSAANHGGRIEDQLPRASTTTTERRSEFANTTTTLPPTTTTLAPTTLPPTTTAPPTTVTTRAPIPPPTAAPARASGCHTSYEGECIPADVSDADCAGGSGNGPYYVKATVKVVGPDVFDLDSNNDGWGCERN